MKWRINHWKKQDSNIVKDRIEGPESELFINLQNAYTEKIQIENNKSNYYHYVCVQIKHARRVCGIKVDPYYEDVQERRFNDQKYNNDLAAADVKINHFQNIINTKLSDLKTQLAHIHSQTQSEQQKIFSLTNSINCYQQQLKQSYIDCNSLNNKISQDKSKLQQLSVDISYTKQQISSIPAKITLEQKQNLILLEHAKDQEIKVGSLVVKLRNEDKNITELIKAQSAENRANLLADLIVKATISKDVAISSAIASIINSGFDTDHLAYLAITQNRTDLLELALSCGADCGAYRVKILGDKTLLQYSIDSEKKDLTQQILQAEDQNIDTTLQNAIIQDDANTIATLAEINIAILHKQIHGCSLLHSAIYANKYSVCKKILSLDQTLAKVSNDLGKSSMEVALEGNNYELTKLIANYVDLQKEAESMIEHHNLVSFELLLQADVLDDTTKQYLFNLCLKHNLLEFAIDIVEL